MSIIYQVNKSTPEIESNVNKNFVWVITHTQASNQMFGLSMILAGDFVQSFNWFSKFDFR